MTEDIVALSDQIKPIICNLSKEKKKEIFSNLPRTSFHQATNQLLDILQEGGSISDWNKKTGHSSYRAIQIIIGAFKKKGLTIEQSILILKLTHTWDDFDLRE